MFRPPAVDRYAAPIRTAFARRYGVSQRAVRGPVGRFVIARYRGVEYALAAFERRGATRAQPELFTRRPRGRWTAAGPTHGRVCTDRVPLMVIRAWALRATRDSPTCYVTR